MFIFVFIFRLFKNQVFSAKIYEKGVKSIEEKGLFKQQLQLHNEYDAAKNCSHSVLLSHFVCAIYTMSSIQLQHQ